MSELWSTEWKIEQLQALADEYRECVKCPKLVQSRQQVVMGSGNVHADVMFVGISPGDHEDQTSGRPFTGPSGETLDSMFASADVKREEFFFDNILACHPQDNREPLKEEIDSCIARLHRTIYIIDPMLIICVGKVPIKALIGSRATSVESCLGELFRCQIPGVMRPIEYDATGIYHPASILRGEMPDGEGLYRNGSIADKTFQAMFEMLCTVKRLRAEYHRFQKRLIQTM